VVAIFDSKQIELKHQRFIARSQKASEPPLLLQEMQNRLLEILLEEVKINPTSSLEIGYNGFWLFDTPQLQARFPDIINHKIEKLDKETIPLLADRVDVIVSLNLLHSINDVVGFLIQSKNLLNSGGLFLASFVGGSSLKELKQVFFDVENRLLGGISPRFMPLIDVKNAGILLQRANFSTPLSFGEEIKVSYKDVYDLVSALRSQGLGNVLLSKPKNSLNKRFFKEVNLAYENSFYADGGILASFEIITLIGWKD
jgi:hypothetical protein